MGAQRFYDALDDGEVVNGFIGFGVFSYQFTVFSCGFGVFCDARRFGVCFGHDVAGGLLGSRLRGNDSKCQHSLVIESLS